MRALLSVAEYLEQGAVGKVGKTIFVNTLPAWAKLSILLRPPLGGMTIDHELPGYRKTSFMLITRAETHEDADELMTTAIARLSVQNTALTNLHVNYMRPRSDPIPYAPTEGNYVELLVNMDTCWVWTG